MKTKYILSVLIFLLLFPSIDGKMCEDVMVPSLNNCTLLTPEIICSQYNYTVLNYSGSIIQSGNLTLLDSVFYSFQFQQNTGGYLVSLCDGSTREITVKGDDTMYFSLVFVAAIFMGLFLFLAWMVEYLYAKIIFIIITLGFGILLYGLGMQISKELGVTTISDLMSAGYPVVMYSSLTLIGLMVVYLLYMFLMGIWEARKGGNNE